MASTSSSLALTCDICVGNAKPEATCSHCDFVTCRGCARRWVTTEGGASMTPRPGCPACQRPWLRAELRRRLGITFVNGSFRTARRKTLRLRETPRLHALGPTAARERRRRILALEARLLVDELIQVQTYLVEDLPEQHAEYDRLAMTLRKVQRRQDELESTARESQIRRYMAQCAHDGCGADLGSDDCCTVCHRKTCMECGVPLDDNNWTTHQCNVDVLATRTLLLQECRPCVQCGALSQKVEGCPTMWCPRCHAFWNWDTGRLIETRRSGVPHNPDHRTWVANGASSTPLAREVSDLPCGGFPGHQVLKSVVLEELLMMGEVTDVTSVIFFAENAARHAQWMREQKYHRIEPSEVHQHPELEAMRIKFLLGDMTETAFSNLLEQTERDMDFRNEIASILEAFVLCVADLLQRFVGNMLDMTSHIAHELETFRILSDSALESAGKLHERKPPRISNIWRWDVPYTRQQPPTRHHRPPEVEEI